MSKKSSQKGWNSEAGYIWSMIGSAVGFANILSFGAKSYQNGGGVFLDSTSCSLSSSRASHAYSGRDCWKDSPCSSRDFLLVKFLVKEASF